MSGGHPSKGARAQYHLATFSGITCQKARLSTARCDPFNQGKINQVYSAMFIAGMEEQLLIAGQAWHAHTAKSALVERLWRIVELPAAEVGLAAVPG